MKVLVRPPRRILDLVQGQQLVQLEAGVEVAVMGVETRLQVLTLVEPHLRFIKESDTRASPQSHLEVFDIRITVQTRAWVPLLPKTFVTLTYLQ